MKIYLAIWYIAFIMANITLFAGYSMWMCGIQIPTYHSPCNWKNTSPQCVVERGSLYGVMCMCLVILGMLLGEFRVGFEEWVKERGLQRRVDGGEGGEEEEEGEKRLLGPGGAGSMGYGSMSIRKTVKEEC